jgi:hypothetical protein
MDPIHKKMFYPCRISMWVMEISYICYRRRVKRHQVGRLSGCYGPSVLKSKALRG